MKPSWREQIRFSEPLRDVRPAANEGTRRLLAEREDAGFERGRIEGERALSEQLLRQRTELQQLQNGLLQSLRQAVPELIQAAEKTLVQLALEAAQKVVADCPISPVAMESAIRETMARVESSCELTIFLHAEDYAMLERANSPALLANSGGQRIHFQASSEVTRGGCLVHTPFGTIDGRRESKFELLKSALQT